MKFVEKAAVSVLAFFVASLIVVNKTAHATTQHVVGGSEGWDESTDFDSWASQQTFKVGDQLVFKYTPGLHSVMELGSESAYKDCDITNSVHTLTGGNDAIKLNKVGTRYFVCGTIGHCGQGMKLKVSVVAANSSSSSSSSSPSDSTASAATHSLVYSHTVMMMVGALLVPAVLHFFCF